MQFAGSMSFTSTVEEGKTDIGFKTRQWGMSRLSKGLSAVKEIATGDAA
jgi:hypothetical protein